MSSVESFIAFIQERYYIALKKKAGQPRPWTEDPILHRYKFTNIHREWDYGTVFFANGWREHHKDDPNLFFASLMYRLINWPPTMKRIEYPSEWLPEKLINTLEDCRSQGFKVYSHAYTIVPPRGKHGMTREVYVANVLTDAWNHRTYIRPKRFDSLHDFHNRLMIVHRVGSFLAAQVVADIKYVGHLLEAPDWHTFAASGPGSRRGLARVHGKPANYKWKEEEWFDTLRDLKRKVDLWSYKNNVDPLHAQDVQNCLCEYHKYEKARLGEGFPRCIYQGEVK